MKRWSRTLESAGFYALAFIVTQVLHELAHAFMGLAWDREPILYTSSVEYGIDRSTLARVLCSAAGPVFSLVQGLVLMPIVRRGPASPRARLLLTWLSFHGLVNFVGYLFSTSFAPGADLGTIAGLLELPLVATLAVTALGYGGLRLLVRPLAPAFAALSDHELSDTAASRGWSKEIGLMAGAVATPALVLAALPVPHWLSLVYVLAAFLPLFDLPKALDRARSLARTTPLPAPKPALAIGLWLAFALAARLALDAGVPL